MRYGQDLAAIARIRDFKDLGKDAIRRLTPRAK